MFRKILVLLIAVGLLASFANVGSALFSSTASVDANAFTAGTLILTTNPTTALIVFSNMAPGDQVTAPLTVSNAGSLQLRYAMTTAATNTDTKALRDQLVLTVKSGVTTCTNGGFTIDGTQIYTGTLNAGALGDPTQGNQAGDRTLNASTNEVLCFHALLPIGTGNSFQGATTTATFTFQAEQTTNNP